MVEVKIDWTEKSLKEYCRFNIFGKTKKFSVLFLILAFLYVVLLAGCLTIFFAFKIYQSLLLAGMLTVFCIVGVLFFRSAINTAVKKAMEENSDGLAESVILGEHSILVCHDGNPVGEIKWDKITEIYLNDKAEAVYINTESGAALILSKENIVSGSMEELKKLTKEKQSEHTKRNR